MVTPFAQGTLLKAAAQAPWATIEELTTGNAVMVLAPHPDDESLGCGAALAAAVETGQDVTVVALTDGSGSHPGSRDYPASKLAALREAELKAAVTCLTSGKARVVFLRYPDQGVPETAHGRQEIVARLTQIVESGHIGTIWTTWKGDPHPDHKAASDIARMLVTQCPDLHLWSFPVWGRFVTSAPDAWRGIVQFDTTAYRQRKAAAIAAHKSQMTHLITDDPDGFVMDREMQLHFLQSPEFFLRETGDEPPSRAI